MDSRLVAMSLLLVLFAGCLSGPADEDNRTEAGQDPTSIAWFDIPLAHLEDEASISVSVTSGINLLRIQVDDSSASAATRSNTMVNHITYVYHGPGPFSQTATCSSLKQPSAFEFQVDDIHYRSKQTSSSESGEHLMLVAAKGPFQLTVTFGSSSSEPITMTTPLTIAGELLTKGDSVTERFPRDLEDNLSVDDDWFVALGARAIQEMDRSGAGDALREDSKGTIWVTLQDGLDCESERRAQYEVDYVRAGTTEIAAAVGGMRSNGEHPMDALIDYDKHDGSENVTVEWRFAAFRLPDIEM